MELRFCEINEEYVKYLHNIDYRVPLPKKEDQVHNRKYIGVVLKVDDVDYFVNLSSYKPYKHDNMNESIDFIKIGRLAVINLNNMIPVPTTEIIEIDINNEEEKYKKLLLRERTLIKKRKSEIYKNSKNIYSHKCKNGENSGLGKRCCDFKRLEDGAQKWLDELHSSQNTGDKVLTGVNN